MAERFHYSMKMVAKRTGLTPHVIRAWERRYGAVLPERSPTNRRLYSEQDVERLLLLRRSIDAGHSIGRIAHLSLEELRELIRTEREQSDILSSTDPDQILEECLRAIRQLDGTKLEAVLGQASVTLSQPDLIERLLVPLLYTVGELWSRGEMKATHEHLTSAVVRTLLGNLKDGFVPDENAPKMILTTPAGQDHELGALLAAVSAASEGWKVIFLGASLPAADIASAAKIQDASVVSLSIVYPPDSPLVDREIRQLGRLLPAGTRLFVGGRSAPNYHSAITAAEGFLVTDMMSFRTELRSMRARVNP